jgi:large subunit ribosomal protein L25
LAAVAGERVRLEVETRDSTGTREARRLRKQGLIPGVLYGRGKKSYAISVPERELRRVLTGDQGLHAILDVVVAGDGDGKSHASILKDYQLDPLRGKIAHIDLQEVRLDQPITASVVVELIGESPGVKSGGVLSQVTREIHVQALPMDIPDHLEADVSGMEMGATLRLADLPAVDKVSFVDDPETVLATVTMPTRVEEPEPEEEEVEGEEAEGVEGEAAEEAPEGAAEAPAEPQAEAAGGEGTTEG